MEKRLNTAIGLVSGAIVAFQLCLMQILSIVQWHHYAAMIIALALLGFGASGTCIALLRERLLRDYAYLLPAFLLTCGAGMTLAVGAAMSPLVRFDALLVFADPRSFWRLTLTCLVFFVPFFLGAMAIGLAFTHNARAIGRLYGTNLIGSGLGGLLAVALMWR
ncbi:spermidine synthase-like protein, partial [bacterium]|nr:spermidine synthase-like protein [bacterium]